MIGKANYKPVPEGEGGPNNWVVEPTRQLSNNVGIFSDRGGPPTNQGRGGGGAKY